jgi:hypothetical protein
MAEKIKLVQNDTRPAIVCTLTDDVTGLPISVTGATPRLKVREVGSTTLQATLEGTVTDGSNGVVVFYPALSPEMLEKAGDFEGEIEIEFSDGQFQTLYDILKFKIREDF